MTQTKGFDEASLDAYIDLREHCQRVAWLHEQGCTSLTDETEGKERRREALEKEFNVARSQLENAYAKALQAGAPQDKCSQVLFDLLPEEALEQVTA